MKTLRLIIIFILAAISGLCLFSYIAGLEEGRSGEEWLLFAFASSAFLCWLLGHIWTVRGKLPDGDDRA
ncbi:MAG: hypothetical protein J5382_10060 [Bacteroidales bacterium]|nr:hypothetical protein [Bacteroidales bacterium]